MPVFRGAIQEWFTLEMPMPQRSAQRRKRIGKKVAYRMLTMPRAGCAGLSVLIVRRPPAARA
ncbi:MAG: hypothetical protein IT539_11050 [Bradyrhizobiaceae bacterium]|nr:hypothetical protein [Bradyrhizobiaceae bacterium]